MCDGEAQCEDGSDESRAEHGGGNLHPELAGKQSTAAAATGWRAARTGGQARALVGRQWHRFQDSGSYRISGHSSGTAGNKRILTD